jgi:hypothetical protein
MLRQAVAHGYKDAEHGREDPELKRLRARQPFEKLVTDLAGKAKE